MIYGKVTRFCATPNEFNMFISYIKSYFNIKFRQRDWGEEYLRNCWIFVGPTRVTLDFKLAGKIFLYDVKIDDGMREEPELKGSEAYAILARYYKPHKVVYDFSKMAWKYKNDKYEGQRVYAYCYDMNSAYPWGLLQGIPDTENNCGTGIVQENMIGFDLNGNVIEVGGFAPIRFNIIPTPEKLVKWVKTWYLYKVIKRKGVNPKQVLNSAIGYLKHINNFIRMFAIYNSEKRMKSIVDENTIYANVDSIYSLVPRPDLDFGKDIGQFKEERRGNFAFVGWNYQWELETPAYRGAPKAWFEEEWDILKDPYPTQRNKYQLNKETLLLEEIDYERLKSEETEHLPIRLVDELGFCTPNGEHEPFTRNSRTNSNK